MGKLSSQKYPAFSGGAVRVNGKTKASTTKNDDTVVLNYNMSDAEKNIYDSVLNNMSSSLGGLFTISDPQRQAWNNQLNVMQQQGLENIDNIYSPMQDSLKKDIASRFGNLDNSAFLNNLKKITDNKAKAAADLSYNLVLAQNDLYANELNNRMNLISLLNNLNNSINGNMLNYMNLSNQNSAAGNSYKQTAYSNSQNNLYNQYQNMQKQVSQLATQLAPLFL